MTTKIMIKLGNGKYIDMSKAMSPEDKVRKVMREFKEGKLKSSSGQKVTERDQAIAIAMSESGMSKEMVHDVLIQYDKMEKARTTKYIKRIPKPSGKGYIYFYTKQQVKDYQEKGKLPEEGEKPKKERKGILGAWSSLADFFGITGNRGSDETAFRSKINEEYSKHKDKLDGADISSFAQHLNEFLANKDKWIAKFSKEPGEKKPSGEKKEPGKKKEPAGEKKPGQKWNINLMKALVEIYGEKKEQQEGWKSGISNDFSKDYKKYAEGVLNDVKKNNNLAKSYLEDIQSDIRRSERMIKSIKKQAQGTGEDFTGAMSGFETRIKDASILSRKIKEITGEYPSPDNFETMPEGMEKIKDEKDNELWTVKKDGFDYRINKTEKGWRVSGGEIGAIQEGNRPITIIGSKLANSPEEALSKHIQEIKDSKKKPSATEALKDELGKKDKEKEGEKKRNVSVFKLDQEITTKPISLNLDFEHPFEIGKVEYPSGKTGYVVLESETGLQVGKGRTQKTAIENAEKAVKSRSKEDFKRIVKRIVNENKPETIAKKEAKKETEKQKAIEEEKTRVSKKIEKEKSSDIYSPNAKKLIYGGIDKKAFKDPQLSKVMDIIKPKNMINDSMGQIKPVFGYSKEGQDAGVWTDSRMMILDKKVSDEIYNTNKQRLFNKLKKQGMSDDEAIDDIIRKSDTNFPNYNQVVPHGNEIGKSEAKFTGKYKKSEGKGSTNILEYSDGENTQYFNADYIASIKSKFPNATIHLNKGEMKPAAFKVGNEIKAILMPIQRGDSEGFSTLEKALSSLREELLLKAQPTKYIKKIPNPKGNGYIYFYTQDQVKEYEKSGKLPEEQKKKPDSQSATGDKKQVLKDALKKVATIFADALSAKDVVQPSGAGVEQVGENISAKKRLDKKKDIKDNTGKNKPEEKPKK